VTLRVLLADDEELVRIGLRAIIDAEADLEVAGEAADGLAAVAASARLAPDVVLMDVRMPVLDGIEATRRIARGDHPPTVVVLTTFEHDDHVEAALHAGAAAFLLKRASPDEIVQAIRLVAADDRLLFPAAVRGLAARRPPDAEARARLARARLTDREQEVLRLMARGLTNTEIAADLVLSTETVKTHVGHILAKLRARDRTQAVVTAYRSGFIPL
jgi:DNA-binding NarL/FixJ family response regulator